MEDPELFIRPDGLPMAFLMSFKGIEANTVKKVVEERGGAVFLRPTLAFRDNIIRLVVGGEVSLRRDQDMFDHKYVLDCVKENMILSNLLDYRINSHIPSNLQLYDPIDVLLGYKAWKDIPEVEGDIISDIEDFFDEDVQVPDRQAPPKIFKTYRTPYSKKQEQEIVNFLLTHSAYKMLKGNSIWQRMEDMGVCKGCRTWQSMKEHFRKKIVYVIHTFGLSWRQVRKFRAAFGLDEEHESDVEEDEEDGFEQNKDNNLQQNRELLFKPRRTSSPLVSSQEVSNRLHLESNCIDEVSGAKMDVNKERDVNAVENSLSRLNNDAQEIGNNVIIDNEEEREKEEESVENVVPAKRKRKLFSTNISYLDPETEPEESEFNVTPVKKKKYVGDLADIEENEEIMELEIDDENESDCTNQISGTKTVDVNAKSDMNAPSIVNNDTYQVSHPTVIRPDTQKDIDVVETSPETLDDIFGMEDNPLNIPPAKRKSAQNCSPNPQTATDSSSSSENEYSIASSSSDSSKNDRSKQLSDMHANMTTSNEIPEHENESDPSILYKTIPELPEIEYQGIPSMLHKTIPAVTENENQGDPLIPEGLSQNSLLEYGCTNPTKESDINLKQGENENPKKDGPINLVEGGLKKSKESMPGNTRQDGSPPCEKDKNNSSLTVGSISQRKEGSAATKSTTVRTNSLLNDSKLVNGQRRNQRNSLTVVCPSEDGSTSSNKDGSTSPSKEGSISPFKDRSRSTSPIKYTKSVSVQLRKLLLYSPHSLCCRSINSVTGRRVRQEALTHLDVTHERERTINEDYTAQYNEEGKDMAVRDPPAESAESSMLPREELNKKNVSEREFWYKSRHRQPYSRGEEEAVINFLLRNGGYSAKGGNKVWQKMEKDWICPGRTWQSLRERFDKNIVNKLEQFGVSKKQLMEADKKIKDGKDEQVIRGFRQNANYYTRDEDLKIIKFIIDKKRFDDVKGNELWQVMEDRKVVEGRSWQSMKERFRKVIRGKIKSYELEDNIIKAFGEKISKRKEKRMV